MKDKKNSLQTLPSQFDFRRDAIFKFKITVLLVGFKSTFREIACRVAGGHGACTTGPLEVIGNLNKNDVISEH